MRFHVALIVPLLLAACDDQPTPATSSNPRSGDDLTIAVSDPACEAVTSFVHEAVGDYETPPPGTDPYMATTLVFRGNPDDPNSGLRCPGVLSIVEKKGIPYGEDAVAWATDVPRGDAFRATIVTIGSPRSIGRDKAAFTEMWLAAPLGGEEHEVTMEKIDGSWTIVERRQTKIF